MKITLVEQQKRNSHRFNVFIDGQFAFEADEDLIVDKRLIIGKEINEIELEKLFFEVEVGKLMERMFRLFNIRQRSKKEVKDYLKQLSFKRKVGDQEELSSKAIDFLIFRLEQKGMINDLEFARSWVEARRKSKQKGVKVIKMELFEKGIAKEIIDELLSNSSEEEDLAKTALKKKSKSWQNLDDLNFKKKATDFLLRRGFEYSVVKIVVDKFLKSRSLGMVSYDQ